MKSDARVVVIGGGVVGASVLYHLAKAGWKDVLLIERGELTCGSTWHAAGGMHTINGDPNVAKLQQYTINLYKEIEKISGQSCGMHVTGGIMLAGTRERLDWLKMAQARGRYLGMELEIISVEEAARLFPLMNKQHFVGALYDPIEGHVDPYGVTHAYARAAQLGGAEVVRHTRVTDLAPRRDGSWDVVTDHGNVHAEHVVNAGGLWAREVGRMVGLELPVLAMEHQYLISGDIPELQGQKEQLHCIDFEGEIYTRQERGGMLLGTYERAGVPWSPRETPWDFSQSLLPEDLERIAPSLEVGFEHFPAIGKAGIRKVVNGPFTFAPDGNPLVGPIRGLRNYLGRLRRHGGIQPGRRGRARAVALDGGRRSGCRYLGDGCRALRRLDHARLHQRQSARELFAPLPHPFPERRADRGASAAHDTDLRASAGRARRVRRLLRTRAPAVVRAERCGGEGGHHLPSLQRARARGARVPGGARGVGAARDLQLREVRGDWPGEARNGSRTSWRTACRRSGVSHSRRCSTSAAS